eukprot:UN04294
MMMMTMKKKKMMMMKIIKVKMVEKEKVELPPKQCKTFGPIPLSHAEPLPTGKLLPSTINMRPISNMKARFCSLSGLIQSQRVAMPLQQQLAKHPTNPIIEHQSTSPPIPGPNVPKPENGQYFCQLTRAMLLPTSQQQPQKKNNNNNHLIFVQNKCLLKKIKSRLSVNVAFIFIFH